MDRQSERSRTADGAPCSLGGAVESHDPVVGIGLAAVEADPDALKPEAHQTSQYYWLGQSQSVGIQSNICLLAQRLDDLR